MIVNQNNSKPIINEVKKFLPAKNKREFYRQYYNLMKPICHMPNASIDLLCRLLEKRDELMKTISDTSIIDGILSSTVTRKALQEELHVTRLQFQYLLDGIRKTGIIKKNTFDPTFIPDIGDEKVYKLCFVFSIKDEEQDK